MASLLGAWLPKKREPPEVEAPVTKLIKTVTVTDAECVVGVEKAPTPGELGESGRNSEEIQEETVATLNTIQDVHRQTTQVIKVYYCKHDGCNKSFARSTGLRQHRLMHTDEKPFTCVHEGCEKAYKTRYALQQHWFVHNGETPRTGNFDEPPAVDDEMDVDTHNSILAEDSDTTKDLRDSQQKRPAVVSGGSSVASLLKTVKKKKKYSYDHIRCVHGKHHSGCKICYPGSFCVHLKRRKYCSICNAAYYCEHKKLARICIICMPHLYCEPHKKMKSYCKLCVGGGICEHGKRRSDCLPCGGKLFCVHNKNKYFCVQCGGKSLCRHGLSKHMCRDCMSMDQIVNSKHFCMVCAHRLSPKFTRLGTRLCGACTTGKVESTESIVRNLLLPLVMFPPSSTGEAVGSVACATKFRKPDLAWYGNDRAIFVEIDEHSHVTYQTSCELGKLWDQTETAKKLLGEHVHVYMLRLNPDRYDGGNVKLNERVAVVAAKINELMAACLPQSNTSGLVPHLGYYYYHSSAQFHIDAALAEPDSIDVFRT